MTPDERWMGAAIALGSRGRGRCAPNPNVGCVIVKHGRVAGRGWTQPGGRPHAEALALDQAGDAARGATAYVTLEPCAHVSERGPACADSIVAAGLARIVIALLDPDPRTNGRGAERLREAGVEVSVGTCARAAARSLEGFLTRRELGRPHVTLKLATSIDGRIALADGSSRWITGEPARRHAHGERARHEAILVGRGTFEADSPALDVRLEGLEERGPSRIVLTHSPFVRDKRWVAISAPQAITNLDNVDHLLVEGGAGAAAAFLRADLVDRLLLYRAPILIGGDGHPAIADLGLSDLAAAHGGWTLADSRMLGSDRLDVYERLRG